MQAWLILIFARHLKHGTGHGVGSFATVHEGAGFAERDVPLQPNHVLTNEPGFCEYFSHLLPIVQFRFRFDEADDAFLGRVCTNRLLVL